MADPIYANTKPFKAEHAYLVDAVQLKQLWPDDLTMAQDRARMPRVECKFWVV